jgi:ABC-type multidrug transport system fused ATPase/permease subunit
LFDWGFSVAEDIGLGRWQDKERHELIDEALRLGGAHTVVSKFKHGSNTVLSPLRTKRYSGVNSSDPLRKFYDKLERSTAVSGGEKQRLVA